MEYTDLEQLKCFTQNDRSLLETTFNEGKPLGKLIRIEKDLSDPHNGGKTVALLTFESNVKIFYKPKSIATTIAFHTLMQQLGLETRDYKTLDRTTYGWEEYVEEKEGVLGYKHAGELLCLFYLLDGVDMHRHNLIFNAPHIIPIDYETLFHMHLPVKYFTHYSINEFPSVLTTGLLPQYSYTQGKITDVSGLTQNAAPHVVDILEGFSTLYQSILKDRSRFLKWLQPFSSLSVRYLARPTRLYDYLLNNLDDLPVLTRYLTEEGKKSLHPMVEAEKKALLQGDVPLFTTMPSTKHLYCEGEVILENAFEKTSLQKVEKRIEKMGEEDLRLQCKLIKQSFLVKTMGLHPKSENICKNETSIPLSKEEFLKKAVEIGHELIDRQLQFDEERIGWIDFEPHLALEHYLLQPISNSLYGGKSGIALFFAALHAYTHDALWQTQTHLCLQDLTSKIQKGYSSQLITQMGIGGMSGAGGASFVLMHCGKLLHDPTLIEQSMHFALSITPSHISQDNHFDLMSGSAGLILSLLALYENIPEKKLIEIASTAATHLIKNAPTLRFGFSHGASGIAYALFKLAAFTKNESYFAYAKTALDYERRHFAANQMASWCHGITGIGFARLATAPFYSDAFFAQEIASAIETTSAKLSVGNYPTLCCSALGRLEFLQMAKIPFQLPSMLLIQQSEESYRPGLMQGSAGLGLTLLRLLERKPLLPAVLILSN